MAHFAQVDDDNIVTQVLVVSNDDEDRGQEFLADDLGLGGTWIQCSYNTRAGIHDLGGTQFRKNYPAIGWSWDAGRDAFIPPKPSPSWVLDETSCLWEAPTPPGPPPDSDHLWDEDTTSWVKPESPHPSWVWKTQSDFADGSSISFDGGGMWQPPIDWPADAGPDRLYGWDEENQAFTDPA